MSEYEKFVILSWVGIIAGCAVTAIGFMAVRWYYHRDYVRRRNDEEKLR